MAPLASNPRDDASHHACSHPALLQGCGLTGEGGIRTRGTPKGTPVFETGSLSRSDTSPSSLFIKTYNLILNFESCLLYRLLYICLANIARRLGVSFLVKI